MRSLGLVGALVIAVLVAVFSQIWIGATIALAALVFQCVLSYGRSQASASVINTPARGIISDLVRNGVFLIPLALSVVARSWLGIVGVVITYLLSISTASHSLTNR